MTATDRLYRRVQMQTASVTISATNDKGPVHLVQGKVRGTPETIDNLQTLNLYGFASHAPIGSDALVIFGNGDRSNGAIIATANQKARPRDQKSGEVTIFSDEGDSISLQRGNIVLVTTKTVTINAATEVTINGATKITINAPAVTIQGTSGANTVINVKGDIHATGTITADTINAPNGRVGTMSDDT
jgi:phage baseplate assembly protein V